MVSLSPTVSTVGCLASPTNRHGLGAVTPDLRGLPDTTAPSNKNVCQHDPLVLRVFFEDTNRYARSFLPVRALQRTEVCCHPLLGFPDFLSWVFPNIAPSPFPLRESCPSFPSRKKVPLRLSAAKHQASSVLVVSHDSDGLLLTKLHRFITPCIQPWSSSCFLPRIQRPIFRSDAVLVAALKLAVHTLQSVPLNNSRNHVSVTRCLHAVEPFPVLNLEALLHC